MKTKFLLLVVSVAAFSSCSTMYKTGQTPDDVYYSPVRGEVIAQKEDKKEENDQVYYYNTEDRVIRMGIMDSRWRYLNNDYGYSPYAYAFNNNSLYYNNFYTPNYNKFYYNNYYYNPYYAVTPVYITPVNTIKNTTPRITNLNGYGKNYNNSNAPAPYVPAPKKAATNSMLGKILDNILTPAPTYNQSNSKSNNTTNTNTSTERTYTPSTSSSSSGSGSSGSSSGGRITRSN